jgi:hypothetical protein
MEHDEQLNAQVFRDLRLPTKLVRQWFASYIGELFLPSSMSPVSDFAAELLHRQKLWSCANEVILASPDESIAQMNQVYADRSDAVLLRPCNPEIDHGIAEGHKSVSELFEV